MNSGFLLEQELVSWSLTSLFSTNTAISETRLEQEVIGWQWHQMDHMQIICASLQTAMPVPHHSHFYRLGAIPAAQQTASTIVSSPKVLLLVLRLQIIQY